MDADKLKALDGLLYIETVSDNFSIFIDNNFYGETPLLITNIDIDFIY